MIKKLYDKIFKIKGIKMETTKLSELELELNKVTRVKVLLFNKDYVTFMYRNKNAEIEVTIKRPKNKSWKNITVNPGSKLNLKLVGGKKNGSPELLVV